MKSGILIALVVGILLIGVILSYEPATTELRFIRDRRVANKINEALKSNSFDKIRVIIPREPKWTYRIEGHVDDEAHLKQLKRVIDHFTNLYPIDFQVRLTNDMYTPEQLEWITNGLKDESDRKGVVH
jgi:hypothetical protein